MPSLTKSILGDVISSKTPALTHIQSN